MILSRKHEYSVGNIRCAFAITTLSPWLKGKKKVYIYMRANQKLSGLLFLWIILKTRKRFIIFLHNLHPFRCTCSSGLQAYKCHLRRKFLAGHTTIDAPLFALIHQKKIYDPVMHL